MIRLSIIVPAYNVADWIERCIRSLEDQDIPKSEYEIIVTNDGSPDRCKEIIENLQKEFSNLILINQENQGVSVARNNAIARAKGEYIMPVDPDDYVLPNSFQHILLKAKHKELDVLYLGFEIFDSEGKSCWKTSYKELEDLVHNGVDGYFAPRGYDVRDPDRSWGILFKKQLLYKYEIFYPKDVPYLEDGLFLGKVFSVATRVGFDNDIFYKRTIRKGSATNSGLFFSEEAMQGFLKAVRDIKEFGSQHQLEKERMHLINHVVAKFVLLTLTPNMGAFKFRKYFRVITLLKRENLGSLKTEGLRFSYKSCSHVFNFSKLILPFYFWFSNKVKQ